MPTRKVNVMTDLGALRVLLADSVVFRGLTSAELDQALAAAAVITRQPGELVLSEGTPGDGLYIVLDGEMEVYLPERAPGGALRPSRVRLNRLGPGRCLGEYAVIDDQPSSASVAALTLARLCFLPKLEFRRLLERHDRIGRVVYGNLLHYLVSRLRGKDRDLDLIVLDEKR